MKLTKEEAIEVLDDMKVKIDIPKPAVTQRKRNDALDMAISALSENKGDLISRQAVLYELKKWDWQDLYLPIHFKQILDDVPSADVRPHIHARWEKPTGKIQPFGEDTRQCTGCGFFTEKDSCYIYNFCPACGADMREPKREKGD